MSERWLPVTPNGRLDGFEWKLPLAELGVSRPVIEAAPPAPPASEAVEAKPVEAARAGAAAPAQGAESRAERR